MSLFEELKRRNVIRVGIAYCLLGWVVLQVVDFLVELIEAPSWVLQVFVIAGAVGLVGVLLFSWLFEMTPEGLKRETDVDRSQSVTQHTGRKLDRLVIVLLALAVALLLTDRFLARQTQSAPETTFAPRSAPSTRERIPVTVNDRSVAVLPFLALSSGPDDEFFADGLTEEILNALAQLPELLVTARTSAFAFKGQDRAVQEIAAELGVRHIVEGSLRRSGKRVRVTAQLVRAEDGFQLWSESYDSTTTDTIAMQEDIAEQIALALDVVLDDERREAMRRAGLRDPAAFIAFQKGIQASREAHGAFDQIGGLLEANRYFDEALDRVPGYPPALLEHADAYVHIINDASSDEPTLTNVPQETVAGAYQQAVADLTAALDGARSLDERSTMEFDLAAVTGDFYRIRERLQAYLATDNCEHPNWVDPLATVFGYAAELRDRLDAVIACNPLGPVNRFSQARSAIWAGDPNGALELVARAREQMSHPWLDTIEIWALIAAGRFESAENLLSRSEADLFYSFLSGTKLAAARGDSEVAAQLLNTAHAMSQDQLGSRNLGGFLMLQYHAAFGNRAEANRLAARIDQQAYGPLPLLLITMWCACGAPFDLEVTPNFAAKLEQGNLPWPPDSPIDFPLKHW
jgi:TolB-like protein